MQHSAKASPGGMDGAEMRIASPGLLPGEGRCLVVAFWGGCRWLNTLPSMPALPRSEVGGESPLDDVPAPIEHDGDFQRAP